MIKILLKAVWVAAAFAALTGCDKPKPVPKTAAPATNAREVARATEEQAALLQEYAPPGAMSAGDKAWREVLNAMREPEVPASWQTNAPSKDEVAAFEKETGRLAAGIAAKALDFYTRFPTHEKVDEAREQEYQLLSLSAQLGDTNSAAMVHKLEEAHLKDPSLSEDDRLEIRIQQLQRRVMGGKDGEAQPLVADLEAGARSLSKEFPNRPEVETLLLSAAQGWLSEGKVDKSRELAKELKASEFAEVKDAAAELLKKIDRVGKAFELKFTALDGRQVDVQAMKGKVVLIDFWATWCRPCIGELPKVKDAYRALHSRGFEIVGISLDSDRSALEKLLAREQMAWPQFFGEDEGGSKMASEFGVSGIPAMWLVDKKGILRDVNARQDLAARVEKLLSEPAP